VPGAGGAAVGSVPAENAENAETAETAESAESAGPAGLLGIGRIVKPHGLRGDVVVSLTTNRHERVAAGSELSAGDGRTFVVVRSSPHRGRFIVSFAGVDGIEAAEALRDTDLFAAPIDDPGTLWVHELVGSVVEDVSGADLGRVVEVQANPASDLLVLDRGGLVPLRFVVSSEPGARVVVDIPDGLLDLP